MPTDVLVIGGGPAGLAAAIAARLKGFDVTVIDAARPPIDKACGEGILPEGVDVLRRLGVNLSAENVIPFRGIRFLQEGSSVEASFPSGCGLAPRRTVLHELLAGRAFELGVRLQWGVGAGNASDLPAARWIVGADGQNSRVRLAAGLDAASSESHRFGFRRHYPISPWSDFVEVYWGERGQIYVTPVSSDEVGVALLTRDSHFRLDCALKEFPQLEKRLRRAKPSSAERGAVTASRRLCHVFRDQTVLVGDASGSVDAIVGQGLSLSFHHALALSEGLSTGDLATYESQHSHLSRRPAITANLLLLLDRSPLLRMGALRLLAGYPSIFTQLLRFGVTRPDGAPCRQLPTLITSK